MRATSIGPDLPVVVGISPHNLLFSRLEPFECLRPGDLEISPGCGHEIIISTGPDDVRIGAISFFQRVREGRRADERRKHKHNSAQGLEKLHRAKKDLYN